MNLTVTELSELLTALNQTNIEELILKSGDFELTVRKGKHIATVSNEAMDNGATASSPQPTPEPAVSATSLSTTPSMMESKLIEVSSPMVGTFYRAPAPDEMPFVSIGERISQGQTICIIEAMKLMNELEAEVSGEVVEILVENGEPVEFGQTLMRVKPV